MSTLERYLIFGLVALAIAGTTLAPVAEPDTWLYDTTTQEEAPADE